MIRRPPISPLFPFTPLFPSEPGREEQPILKAHLLVDKPARGSTFGVIVGSVRGRGPKDGFSPARQTLDRKSTRLNSSHANISYAVFCLKKKISIILSFDSNK